MATTPAVRERFTRHSADGLAMSKITYGELCGGAGKSQAREKALAVLKQLTGRIQVLPLPPDAGIKYGRIRTAQERNRRINPGYQQRTGIRAR